MKKIILITVGLLAIGQMGCADSAMNTNSRMNANPPRANANVIATPLKTPADSLTNTGSTGNARGNSRSNVSMSNSMMMNSRPPNAQVRPSATPPPTAEIKDEGLFSFPPPKVISYTVIEKSALLNREGQTNFSQISERLAAGLERAGYADDRYSYFWNEKDEFAIVTQMERINPDGTPLGSGRWNGSTVLPRAHGAAEYFDYLISGKKVYYRVFAFVVTGKRSGRSFSRNTSPDFTMALNWMNKGEAELGGGGEPSVIEDAVFGERYNCYALLYLFVNHTSLDAPKSIDTLTENEESLRDELNQEAGTHLRQTKINFGG